MAVFRREQPPRPRVAIIGAGFGGLSAARALAGAPVEVTLIDKRNYHLFQPLLYQVATADLSPADVAWPIRSLFSNESNVNVMLGRVDGVDVPGRAVITDQGRVDYEYLIIATGSYHSYFGKEHWEPFAPGLKRVIDATEVRKRVLISFERAETAATAEQQRRLLTFVLVGGGPTGVEMAGAIAELSRWTLARDFRRINSADARVILVEAGDRLLKAFPESLSTYAQKALEKLGVEVRLGVRVDHCDAQGVRFGAEEIPAATVVWAAGVRVRHVGEWLGVQTDRTGRVPVAPDLSLPEAPEIFIVGDAAKAPWRDGQDVPGIAPAAKQGGAHVAATIRRLAAGREKRRRFRYRHRGNLATIGRHSAIADFGWIRLTGGLAWWLWGIAHIYFLIGVRAPVIVAMQWFWSYLTYARGARLITGTAPLFEFAEEAARAKAAPAAAAEGPAAAMSDQIQAPNRPDA